MNRLRGRRWDELTPRQRIAVVVLGVVQLSLAAYAWADLARRPAARVRGSKSLWGWVIAVNWVGPVSYLVWGRRPE
jgi:hypothetical protein